MVKTIQESSLPIVYLLFIPQMPAFISHLPGGCYSMGVSRNKRFPFQGIE